MSDQSVTGDLSAVRDAVAGDASEATPAKRSAKAKAKAKDATGHAKFRKLAIVRTKAAIRSIRLLAKMGRSRVFEYSTGEADKIAEALQAELDLMKKGLSEPQHQLDIEFDL